MKFITKDEWIVNDVVALALLIKFETFILVSSFAGLNLEDLMGFLNMSIFS